MCVPTYLPSDRMPRTCTLAGAQRAAAAAAASQAAQERAQAAAAAEAAAEAAAAAARASAVRAQSLPIGFDLVMREQDGEVYEHA